METHVGVEVGDEEHRVDSGGGHAVDGHPSCHCWWRDGERSQSTRHRLHRQTWAERSPAGKGQMGRGRRERVMWETGRERSRTIIHFHNLLPLFQINNIRSSCNSLLNQCVQACWVNLVQMSIELDGWVVRGLNKASRDQGQECENRAKLGSETTFTACLICEGQIIFYLSEKVFFSQY